MSLVPSQANPHSFGLTIGRDSAFVRLSGSIGLPATADLDRLMASLDLLAYMTIDVDLSDVTFLDGHGVRPLVEATHRRWRERLPPVRIGRCSPAARYYLDVSGLEGQPTLNLSAWPATAISAANEPGVVPVAEGDADTVPLLHAPPLARQRPPQAPVEEAI